jgi:hypothetical protein
MGSCCDSFCLRINRSFYGCSCADGRLEHARTARFNKSAPGFDRIAHLSIAICDGDSRGNDPCCRHRDGLAIDNAPFRYAIRPVTWNTPYFWCKPIHGCECDTHGAHSDDHEFFPCEPTTRNEHALEQCQ